MPFDNWYELKHDFRRSSISANEINLNGNVHWDINKTQPLQKIFNVDFEYNEDCLIFMNSDNSLVTLECWSIDNKEQKWQTVIDTTNENLFPRFDNIGELEFGSTVGGPSSFFFDNDYIYFVFYYHSYYTGWVGMHYVMLHSEHSYVVCKHNIKTGAYISHQTIQFYYDLPSGFEESSSTVAFESSSLFYNNNNKIYFCCLMSDPLSSGHLYNKIKVCVYDIATNSYTINSVSLPVTFRPIDYYSTNIFGTNNHIIFHFDTISPYLIAYSLQSNTLSANYNLTESFDAWTTNEDKIYCLQDSGSKLKCLNITDETISLNYSDNVESVGFSPYNISVYNRSIESNTYACVVYNTYNKLYTRVRELPENFDYNWEATCNNVINYFVLDGSKKIYCSTGEIYAAKADAFGNGDLLQEIEGFTSGEMAISFNFLCFFKYNNLKVFSSSPANFAVLSTDPVNGATNFPQTSTVTINLNSNVNASTITEESLYIRDTNDRIVNYSINSTTSNKIELTADFYNTTTYTITLTTGIANTDQMPLSTNYEFSFTTAKIPLTEVDNVPIVTTETNTEFTDIVIQCPEIKGNNPLWRLHFKIDSYQDSEKTNLIDSKNSVDNPEFFYFSNDKGLNYFKFPTDGLPPEYYRSLIKVIRFNTGRKNNCYLQASIGAEDA